MKKAVYKHKGARKSKLGYAPRASKPGTEIKLAALTNGDAVFTAKLVVARLRGESFVVRREAGKHRAHAVPLINGDVLMTRMGCIWHVAGQTYVGPDLQ